MGIDGVWSWQGRWVMCAVAVLAGACASAPPSKNLSQGGVVAQVLSEPAGLEIAFRGKTVGPAPVEVSLARLEDAIEVTAKLDVPPTMERRIRVLSPNQVQVLIRAGGEPSPMARRLGLSKVLVFDYGDAMTFEVDRADLSPSILPLLSTQAELLKSAFAGIDVYICGHTDATGGSEHNEILSLDRARSVSEFLASLGVENARLKAQGFGPDYPVASNETPEGRALNRRTEIVLPD